MNKSNKPNKTNKSNKFSTLNEVIEALERIDKKAAQYLGDNFDEETFRYGTVHRNGALRSDSSGPLDFFFWHIHRNFDWATLNDKLKQIDRINLNDYTTKDVDLTGCNPVIAEALKRNKSILCAVRDEGRCLKQQYNIVSYRAGKPYPYVTTNHNVYKHAEPIKTTKTELTELRVKDPVSIMQWLIDNGYVVDKSVFFQRGDERYCLRSLFAYCGCLAPERWPLPELLEEVAVIYESDTDVMDDPFECS